MLQHYPKKSERKFVTYLVTVHAVKFVQYTVSEKPEDYK